MTITDITFNKVACRTYLFLFEFLNTKTKKMKTLSKGNEPNLLKFIVNTIDIKPYSEIKRGSLEQGLEVKITHYNLEDLLCQMLEDYGTEELIKRIKGL